jgi:hypothetical protein
MKDYFVKYKTMNPRRLEDAGRRIIISNSQALKDYQTRLQRLLIRSIAHKIPWYLVRKGNEENEPVRMTHSHIQNKGSRAKHNITITQEGHDVTTRM